MRKIAYNDLLEIIGKNLHTVRNARKETLQGVAKTLGFTHPVLSKIENGKHENLPLSLLVTLCNYYEISLQQCMALETAQIFQLTQHNQNGSNRLIAQEVAAGYEAALAQAKDEITYLRNQLQNITAAKRK